MGIYDPSPDPNAQPMGVPQQLTQFFSNPNVNAALLNAGLALMQPPSFGDTAASQIARAIGAGGQAVQSLDKQEQDRIDRESKQELRSAQADAAGARSEAAASRANAANIAAGAAQTRAEAAAAAQEQKNQFNALGIRLKMSQAYQSAKTAFEKLHANDKLLTGQDAPEFMGFDDWVAQNPQLAQMYGAQAPNQPANTPVSPPAYGTGAAGTGNSTLPKPPPAPQNPNDRKANTPYTAADGGVVYWDPKVGKWYR